MRVKRTELSLPVLIDVLNLVDLLLNALTGYSVGLQLINLLVNQVGDGFVEILQEVLDHLWDDMVGLLLILPLIGQICFRVACNDTGEGQEYTLICSKTVFFSTLLYTDYKHLYEKRWLYNL